MKRRNFLINSALGSAGALFGEKLMAAPAEPVAAGAIRIGICTDIHLDTVYDGMDRLKTFIAAMQKEKPDLVLQLGDFCSPKENNKPFVEAFNQFTGPKYHVIGNHDTDGDFTRDQVATFLGMPARYYSFDIKGYHFVVLDSNEFEFNKGRNPAVKYSSYISDEQIAWLQADLDKTNLPVIVMAHHGLDNDIGGVENAVKVRALFDRCNEKAKRRKVQLVLSGHFHQDYHNVFNGIHYLQMNSMSYYWMGKGHEHMPYGEEVDKKWTWVKYTAPYKDPLWAVAEISAAGELTIKGKRTQYVGKTPVELGVSPYPNGYPGVPHITDKKLKLV